MITYAKEYLGFSYLLAKRYDGDLTTELLRAAACYEKFKDRLENDELIDDPNFIKACEKLQAEMKDLNFRQRMQEYYKMWKITLAKPWIYLYNKKWENLGVKYVEVQFVDYISLDDSIGHSRRDIEIFQGSGKSTTLQEFWEEINRQYKGCWWTEPVGIYGPYDTPTTITYQWVDGLRTEVIK